MTTMTLRAQEIGADKQSRNNHEMAKNNISPQPNETELRFAYPELEPGRALLDLERGLLHEVMHSVNGHTETVEETKSSFEEYLDEEYGDGPEGQDWGGIIQHHYISVATRESPLPNRHNEIQVPIQRPSEHDITDYRPKRFESQVLTDADGETRPLLLLERPSVTYEEVIPGETYDIIGWFDPVKDSPENRINDIETITSRHPEVLNLDVELNEYLRIPVADAVIRWDNVDADSDYVEFTPSDDGTTPTAEPVPNTEEFHIGRVNGQLTVDCPFDSNSDAKKVSAFLNFDRDLSVYTTDLSLSTLREMIETYTADGYTVTVDASLVEQLGDRWSESPPEAVESATLEEIVEFAFNEEAVVSTIVEIPNLGISVDMSDTSEDALVEFTLDDDGDISTSITDDPADSHIHAVVEGTLRVDTPKKHADLVKELNWDEYRYKPDFDDNVWTMQQSALAPLIEIYTDADVSITAPLSVIDRVGVRDQTVDNRRIEVDQDALTFADSYPEGDYDDDPFETEFSVDVTAGPTDDFIADLTVTNADGVMSLMNLDMQLKNDHHNTTVSGVGDISDLPDKTKREWSPALTDDEHVYAWHKPETNERVEVRETEGWGTEYELYVKEADMDEPEHVVTLADERMIVQQAVLHLRTV